ncbi:nitrate reductase [Ruegeria sediminis]|uniref:Chaperone NapD n=1 Tax=Ruegeria sediminis TaxID=2583820 RepID=A0ABY2WUB7_9RHOB|nr:chaperone NapD [Ruegeria sediminis]TMV05614.1 nitrate reductase [Ruegeria sediminis]
MNICGCLVHVLPERTEAAAAEMAAMDGVEIHARSEDGRFVVVVEDTEAHLASDTIMALHQVAGVVSLTLTYHHFEDLAEAGKRPASLSPSQAGAQTNDHF